MKLPHLNLIFHVLHILHQKSNEISLFKNSLSCTGPSITLIKYFAF